MNDNVRDRGGPYEFTVNGVEVKAPERILTAGEILKLAKEEGAIPRDPEKYTLHGAKGPYNWDDKVDLKEENNFKALPNTPPPAV